MRTTLDLDEDILEAAKALGALHGRTAGQMLSELARKALTSHDAQHVRNGVPLLPTRPGRIVTARMVDEAMDQP